MQSRDWLKQGVTKKKKKRKSKEKYRLNAKKKAIKYLNKRKVEMLLKDQKKKRISKVPIQNIEKNTPVDNEDDIDFQIETAGSKNDDGDVIYVKYVPPPPGNPVSPMHPRDRLTQRVKKIRQKEEKYRINAKKKAIKYLNKRKVEMLLKDHINKQKLIRQFRGINLT